jgi:hypothetical protein
VLDADPQPAPLGLRADPHLFGVQEPPPTIGIALGTAEAVAHVHRRADRRAPPVGPPVLVRVVDQPDRDALIVRVAADRRKRRLALEGVVLVETGRERAQRIEDQDVGLLWLEDALDFLTVFSQVEVLAGLIDGDAVRRESERLDPAVDFPRPVLGVDVDDRLLLTACLLIYEMRRPPDDPSADE